MKALLQDWRRALFLPVKVKERKDWEALDFLSRWFITTRSSVSTLTFYSCAIGGLLAWEHLATEGQDFPFLPWLAATLGLFVAHGVSNLVNDHVDVKRGVDSDNYFRTHYVTHPLLQGFMSQRTHAAYFWGSTAVSLLAGLYVWYFTSFALPVVWFFLAGAVILLFYTWPFKHIGLGELSIFLIWGPLKIAAVYFVLAGSLDWMVVWASLPFGLNVGAANNAEHLDKLAEDTPKGVHTLPVIMGDVAARWLTIIALLAGYVITIGLVFLEHYFTPVMLLVLVALKTAVPTIRRLLQPKPASVPDDHPFWPMWFFGDTLKHCAVFGNWFVLALFCDVLLRIFAPGFWR